MYGVQFHGGQHLFNFFFTYKPIKVVILIEIGLSSDRGTVKLYESGKVEEVAMITSGQQLVLEKVSQSVLVIHHQTLILLGHHPQVLV